MCPIPAEEFRQKTAHYTLIANHPYCETADVTVCSIKILRALARASAREK
jgi:hypothetical protein